VIKQRIRIVGHLGTVREAIQVSDDEDEAELELKELEKTLPFGQWIDVKRLEPRPVDDQ